MLPTCAGQGVPAQGPTASTEAQNANLNAPAPAPLQDSTASIGNTQAAGSTQLDQQQNGNPSATAAYSTQYASAPQAADSAYSGAAVAPAPVLDSASSTALAPSLDAAYSGAAVAPAPVLEGQYGSNQAVLPQSTSSFGSGKWQMADPATSAQAPAALSASSTYTSSSSNSGMQLSNTLSRTSREVSVHKHDHHHAGDHVVSGCGCLTHMLLDVHLLCL